MTNELTASQLRVANYLDKLLDEAIKGDFTKVLQIARQIHQLAKEDKKILDEKNDTQTKSENGKTD